MNTIVASETNITNTSKPTSTPFPNAAESVDSSVVLSDDVVIRLGIWLSGLKSFLQIRNYSFGENNRAKVSTREWTKEFHLTSSALSLCSSLTLQLLHYLESEHVSEDGDGQSVRTSRFGVTFDEVSELANVLKQSILLNEALLRSEPLKFTEWTAWSVSLGNNLNQVSALQKLIEIAEKAGERSLPAELQRILQDKPIPFSVEADLRIILPRVAKILRWLEAIDEMRQKDEPLKTSLLLFSRIYEQTQEMMSYINNRLLRFTNQEDPIYEALDSTIYAASIESKKVFNFELAGLSELRQAPRIFAKVETSYSLLNDSFQQTLVNFAQLIEPEVDPKKIFPNFQTKLEQSLELRSELWRLHLAVRKAEQNPDEYPMPELHEMLNSFLRKNLRYLFYKDCETAERFVEEVLRTPNKNDLVPILHRFGAYLETLLGQVNMRTLLAPYPFDYPKE